MWYRALPLLLLASFPQVDAAAQFTPTASCLDATGSAAGRSRCIQLAASARLRARPEPRPLNAKAARAGSTGKGALVGLGVGLGLGILAAVVVAPACEENQTECEVTLVVGGSAFGAGIGAIVGAAVGKD